MSKAPRESPTSRRPQDKISARSVLFTGLFLFVAAMALFINRLLGPQFAGFLMCIGLGFVFAAAGDQGELQAKSEGGPLSWLGGLAIPFARFVGGASISVLLLVILAFLAPWISVDADNYTRVLVRTNAFLKNYKVSVRTNEGTFLFTKANSDSNTKDFQFVVFSSDLKQSVIDLILNADINQPDSNYLYKVEISDIPASLFQKQIGNSGYLRMDLDLQKGTLKTADKCYRHRDSLGGPNPCLEAVADAQPVIRASSQPTTTVSSTSLRLVSAAFAESQFDVDSRILDLGSRLPEDRTRAYSELLDKGSATFEKIISTMNELLASWSTNRKLNTEEYYRLLNLINLSAELTNRGLDEKNKYRTLIGKPLHENPGTRSVLIDGLIGLSDGTDRSLKLASSRLLPNIVDNTTVFQVIGAFDSTSTPDGKLSLLNTMRNVSRFACKENADGISRILENKRAGSNAQMNRLFEDTAYKLTVDLYRQVPCAEYWKKKFEERPET